MKESVVSFSLISDEAAQLGCDEVSLFYTLLNGNRLDQDERSFPVLIDDSTKCEIAI